MRNEHLILHWNQSSSIWITHHITKEAEMQTGNFKPDHVHNLFATEMVFCSLPQGTTMKTVPCYETFSKLHNAIQNNGAAYTAQVLCCFITMPGHTLLLKPKNLSHHLSMKKWIIPPTAQT